MSSLNAQEMYQFMNERNIILSFVGDLTREVTTPLLQNIKKSINKLQIRKKTKTVLYDVIVECIDNISRHNVVTDTENKLLPEKSVMFIFCRDEHNFTVITGNHVYSERVKQLQHNLETINSSDNKKLKKLYDEVLSHKFKTGREQIGLGMIEIALSTGSKFKYEFREIGKGVSFYVQQVLVPLD